LSVTRPFDSSPAFYYKWSVITMRLSCTVMEIWHLKDNAVTTLTFWGHVTLLVTWPFDSRRCGASNIVRTDVDMERKMEEGKEKEEGGGEGK